MGDGPTKPAKISRMRGLDCSRSGYWPATILSYECFVKVFLGVGVTTNNVRGRHQTPDNSGSSGINKFGAAFVSPECGK